MIELLEVYLLDVHQQLVALGQSLLAAQLHQQIADMELLECV